MPQHSLHALINLAFDLSGFSHSDRCHILCVLRVAWYISLCCGLVVGAGGRRNHRQTAGSKRINCKSYSECRIDLGEVCYKLYEGCSLGRCMCNPASEARDKKGRCRTVRRGGENCYAGDKCPDQMTCHYNICTCFVGEMTSNGESCLRTTQQLLSHSCNPSTDTCVQKSGSGYSSDDVICSDTGICQCLQGFKADGFTCRRHRIGESGCVENHHCDGGSVCESGQCICPLGRIPMAANTKCGRTGALHGLPLGASCDEIGEKKYCDHGLVCHSCGDYGRSVCVKSRLPSYQSQLYAHQGAAAMSLSITCLFVAITSSCLVNR